jgi:two-component system CheB/CheR fusion protein
VRRFTEQVDRVIHLREGDIGRPLSDLASTLCIRSCTPTFRRRCARSLSARSRFATTDGRWYTVRIMPYRTLTNVIQGVVITFVDITVAKELESRLRKA